MKVVIVGGSHAGIACADSLRRRGFDGSVTIIERQGGLPLERPPLSKAFLAADAAEDDSRFALRGADWFTGSDVTLLAGCTVADIDHGQRLLCLDDGSSLVYDRLVLAMGATPRRLPAAMGLGNVHELRTPEDAVALRNALGNAASAIVIGGGYIGLEVAASLIKTGIRVDVVEAADRLLARVASPVISTFFADLHADAGARLHVGVGVTDIRSQDGNFAGVTLADGQQLAADMLVVGIGVLPETGLAAKAGCLVEDGIVVDDHMATSIDGIYAIGDGARHQHSALRIESVHNAQDSGERAAAAITGTQGPAMQAPWFWSEQYDARLQSAGLVPALSGDVEFIRRPGRRENGFSVWSLEGGTLRAVEAVRDPAGYMLGKTCLERDLRPSAEQLADPGFDLKAFVAG